MKENKIKRFFQLLKSKKGFLRINININRFLSKKNTPKKKGDDLDDGGSDKILKHKE